MFDKLLDFAHPFFKPKWRRVAVVAVCFFMALVEFVTQSAGWASIFLVMGFVAYWKLFLDAETQRKLDEMED